MIARLIGSFVTILVGVSLIYPMSKTLGAVAENATATQNITGYGITVLHWTPAFFAIGIIGMGVAIAYNSLRDIGMFESINGGESEPNDHIYIPSNVVKKEKDKTKSTTPPPSQKTDAKRFDGGSKFD